VRDREVIDVLVGVGAATSGLALGLARPLKVAAGVMGAGCLRVLRRQQAAVRFAERGRQVRTGLEHAVTEAIRRVFAILSPLRSP
jgi:tRNA(Arg) A34 adenosine deaminase TadA